MKPIYQPSQAHIENTLLHQFQQRFEQRLGQTFDQYVDLHQASIHHPEAFWQEVWQFTHVVGDEGSEVLASNKMPGAEWFPAARLNFAENLLGNPTDALAIQFRGEGEVEYSITRKQLHEQVSRIAQALTALGVEPGDRVAAFLPNLPETVVVMLAATSLGAVFSSCSPDFGVQGVVDRFSQIEPKVLFAVDGYYYKGTAHDCLEKVAQIEAALPSLKKLVLVPYIQTAQQNTLSEFVEPYTAKPIKFEKFSFNHPLYILFSSGTTGTPKAIVHGAGGTLLQHLKEHQLHTNIKPGDRVFYFTTCGWMMWNWLVSALASDAALVLYDGSPFHPTPNVLFDYIEDSGCKVFGTSAKYLEEANKNDMAPIESHDLSKLEVLLSTGSPLASEGYDFVYQKIKADVQLSSISGGTDIVSCFVLGCPTLPVYRGEIQCAGLGMAVELWNDEGEPVLNEKGELVCVQPFPSMPIGFWADEGGEKYRAAYFDRFPGVWHHGDYASTTEQSGFVIYGRSDAVLNPGGVRIGTAEIYRQVDLVPEVLGSIVIGQQWQSDVRVVLFVKLQEGMDLTDELATTIKKKIRANTTPRHVPAKVIQVADIPRTRSGKLVEIAVRDIVHGKTIGNLEAIANPEALSLFKDLRELES